MVFLFGLVTEITTPICIDRSLWSRLSIGMRRFRAATKRSETCTIRPSMPPWLSPLRFALLLLSAGPFAWAALDPSQVAVLVNKDTPISSQVGRMYEKLRDIPPANILTLYLGSERQITPDQYWGKAAPPIKKYLEVHPEIRCIVTTSGVPYTIKATDGKDEGAAFDNELAAVLREQPGERKRGQPNPLFLGGANPVGLTDPRKLQMVYVVRLDGPDLKTITRMVEDAIAAEKSGLDGPVYGDAQGIDGVTGYGLGDASIRAAIDRFSGAGFVSKLDMKQESWKQPKGGVGDQAAGAAFYLGWYDLLNFQNIFGEQGLARGSIAWHIASQEAQDIWDLNGKGWCVNLMRRGAAVTLGPVREPYVTAFPHGDIFTEVLLTGNTVAESYWLALPQVSWAMVLLGDPLYRPFGSKPRPSLVARAYLAGNSTGVLEKGETSSLLVLVECVGPAGSGTPALTAMAEPEMGLAAASGSVAIPALKAGENALIKVPNVTAGADPTGMFRLRLNAQDDNHQSRRIVLEGRIGFSRLTAGLLSKSQMFVSPTGDELISGRPGSSVLIPAGTLEWKPINAAAGLELIEAQFSPDGAHVVLALLDPKQKKAGEILADNKLGNLQSLPPRRQFLRWLGKDEMLLKAGNRLIRHPLTGGEDYTFQMPADWSAPAVAGTVIPGTEILYATSADGKMGFANGPGPFHEVLRGTGATRFAAIANDLSLFGGVDSQKRLWIQRGVDADPEILATGVERVIWGPISHRALVVGENGKSRVYDNRDRSWIDLGVVPAAQWSPDEERLVFVSQDGPSQNSLSVLIDGKIEKLCDFARIGSLQGMVIAAGGEKAFLLAGLSGQLDVWMMALPAHAAPPLK
jgi:uncharacterized protein (TIGR03790 family)